MRGKTKNVDNILWFLMICLVVLLAVLVALIAIYFHARKGQPSEKLQKTVGLYIVRDDLAGDLLKIAASFYLIAATALTSIVCLVLAAIAFLLLAGGAGLLEFLKILRGLLP